ncbi:MULTISPECIES: hypothetical protein [Pseudomonas syringae group]|uniref:Uncharacterized protein n=1 Tax=Pseudomonas syringae pv. papulans TaxID=83963 RepID=A0A0P9Y2R4_PSESX|nr:MULTISPECIES: hypothetical protein [Pseudomonas syringae group]EPF66047.1 Prophage PssSM-01, Orf35 [Pseudomonas syringae pv. syringae SM]KPY27167.1 Prophage PssSM-01, Orf35 [Pseudomonas syringae pv. papulans]KWS42331.1 hypothetical protein AL059_19070 [Pseudomonas syringae pv. papulans]MDH4601812.1 hypothetical protein [Pseudomonas syringae pv. papulans]MDH4623721.1 hypothetical protein [Pseudomonas syringae pv. papulans]
MHIQIITGAGKTARLQATLHELLAQGCEARIIEASVYTAEGLRSIMDVVASGGHRTLLVDDCTTEQIEAVLIWQSDTDESNELDDLTIHLVRKA